MTLAGDIPELTLVKGLISSILLDCHPGFRVLVCGIMKE
jgi:hypothetical protein